MASHNGTNDGVPNVLAVATAPNYGRFAVGPFEPGYAAVLGNALRRILLSSLPGSAITSIRIQSVYHEFSCIPYIKEDVTEIVLNVKNIRLRSYSERAVRLQLSKTGPGEVRAGDIDLPANIELVNPELVLATLDNEEGHLEMELTVERGRGYVSSDSREGMPIGTIPVDAIFTPIPKVNYIIEPASPELITAGQPEGEETPPPAPEALAGLEQLVIEIWSDGTVDPGEALSLSAQYLAQHSALIANFNRAVAPQAARDTVGADIPVHLFDMPIDELNLSMRTYNCLKRSGVTKVGQVLRMDRKELLGLRNFGQKSLVELYDSLRGRDLIPPGTPLDVPPEVIYGTESAEGAEGAEGGEGAEDADQGEGAVEAQASEDAATGETGSDTVGGEVGYENQGDRDVDTEAEGYMDTPGNDEEETSTAVIDSLATSEGSVGMSRGIYVDQEFSGAPIEGEDVDLPPDSVENQQPGTKAKKKR